MHSITLGHVQQNKTTSTNAFRHLFSDFAPFFSRKFIRLYVNSSFVIPTPLAAAVAAQAICA